jgi:hypothetical protein
MKVHTSKDFVHSFDNPDVNRRRIVLSHSAQYNFTASRNGFSRTRAFPDHYLQKTLE